MPFTHSFTFTPPRRYGSGIGPWTQVRVEESSDDETFAAVETLDLDGTQVDPATLDSDPSEPDERSITTEVALLEIGYFRVIWLDGDGDESPASESVLSPGTAAADVLERLRRLTAAAYDPQLDEEDLAELLVWARRADSAGRLPDDADWEPTYDLNYAAASGWDIKAARAAGDFRFEEDNQVFHRDQVFRHCSMMAKRYRRSALAVPMVRELV